ncbi:MAG: hypothetical protein KDD55_11860, partial [Bdellovibrionales bacterium]|nr:hypothetical protein [Bdellovibrionales bacterium]
MELARDIQYTDILPSKDVAPMSCTHLDSFTYRGANALVDTSSYVSFNPHGKAGNLVFAGARAVKQSIGSQVACKLSLEHFIEGILDYFGGGFSEEDFTEEEPSLRALEAAFKRANKSVYSFGHSLAAGGRMAAAFIGLVLEDDMIASGRVGNGSAYLYRAGELFPFFDSTGQEEGAHQEGYLGTQSLVSVELASVATEPHDVLYVFSQELSEKEENDLISLSQEMDFTTAENPI